jgi:hypothetical protein
MLARGGGWCKRIGVLMERLKVSSGKSEIFLLTITQ